MPKFSTKQVGILNHSSPVFRLADLVNKFDTSGALLDLQEHDITADENSNSAFSVAFDSDVLAVLKGYIFDPTTPAAATALDLSKISDITGGVVTFAAYQLTAGLRVLLFARCQEV